MVKIDKIAGILLCQVLFLNLPELENNQSCEQDKFRIHHAISVTRNNQCPSKKNFVILPCRTSWTLVPRQAEFRVHDWIFKRGIKTELFLDYCMILFSSPQFKTTYYSYIRKSIGTYYMLKFIHN
jgi:hypothetical protein